MVGCLTTLGGSDCLTEKRLMQFLAFISLQLSLHERAHLTQLDGVPNDDDYRQKLVTDTDEDI